MRVLVVEDNKKTASFIAKALKSEGFAVNMLNDGDEALVTIAHTRFDGEIDERIAGLNAGADDYLAKPFALGELLARVRALVRRGGESKAPVLRVADLTLDTATRKAQRGEQAIELSTREYRLLELLMRSPDRVCGRMLILEKAWDYNFDPGSNIVDVYIRKLRDKIDKGFEPKLLHTVRGTGYVIRVKS